MRRWDMPDPRIECSPVFPVLYASTVSAVPALFIARAQNAQTQVFPKQ